MTSYTRESIACTSPYRSLTRGNSKKTIYFRFIPLRLKNFENSIEIARNEQIENDRTIKKERTSSSLNKRILLASTIALSIIGLTYYLMDARIEIFQPIWLVLASLWYFSIAFSIYFIHKGLD